MDFKQWLTEMEFVPKWDDPSDPYGIDAPWHPENPMTQDDSKYTADELNAIIHGVKAKPPQNPRFVKNTSARRANVRKAIQKKKSKR